MRLFFVVGDQLDPDLASLRDADPNVDAIAMAEVADEAAFVWNHKQRIALFFSAMRHWAEERRAEGFTVHYQKLDDADAAPSLPAYLRRQIDALGPGEVVCTRMGRYGLEQDVETACTEAGVPLRWVEDDHYLATRADFAAWAEGRKTLTMEYFYREQRRAYRILLTDDGEPEGGAWNYDEKNRKSFGKDGPGMIKAPIHFRPDDITQEVLDLVATRFPSNPGSLDGFDWPVTHDEALRAVRDFVEHRLPLFGTYQDAIWAGRPYLYHSRISAAMNLHLVNPRYVLRKAEDAYRDGHAPLNAVEGFIRQILGWREFMRGVYWLHMPALLDMNALGAERDLPDFYWTGETHMACVRDVVTQLLDTAYAHHIQRLMVTGLFAQLYGARPRAVHDWYMALYTDAVEWVTLPNTVGMSQYADGGIVGSKPYVATGKYVHRQSNYCAICRYDKDAATGEDACPFTTLYWHFLDRHQDALRGNGRMRLQVRNLDRKSDAEVDAIRERAAWVFSAAEAGEL